MNIAFIGLGNMGLPMARNLVKAGLLIKGFDLSATALEAFATAGGTPCASAADTLEGADVVVTMLPAGKHVKALWLSDSGLLHRLRPGTLLIDSSTIAATAAREVASAAAVMGIDMIDAPVSGGTAAADAGTLTFMVGGTPEQLERARPVLEHMGKRVLHAGAIGAGQVAKACNNMLLGIIMAGSSEALQLGIAHGLDPKVLSDIINVSTGANWVLSNYNPCPGTLDTAPSARGYTGGFATDLMLKDLGLAVEAATDAGAIVPLGSSARNLFAMHSAAGQGRLDCSSVFHLLAARHS
jgi:3-hydroxyisobutyrate dehydrogenase